jgi:hypothetical protein
MKNFFILSISLFIVATSNAQTGNNNVSFADTVRWYFDYEKLSMVSCSSMPPGVYALTFNVSKQGKPYDFFSNNTLINLQEFLIDAVTKRLEKVKLEKSKDKYIQLIYFNNFIGCKKDVDTAKNIPDTIVDLIRKIFKKKDLFTCLWLL